jgi:hypothetical protein
LIRIPCFSIRGSLNPLVKLAMVHYDLAFFRAASYRFRSLCPFAASFCAAAIVFGTGSPHACALNASRVGLPFRSTMGPRGCVNVRARNEPLRFISSGLFAVFTPGFKREPSFFAK